MKQTPILLHLMHQRKKGHELVNLNKKVKTLWCWLVSTTNLLPKPYFPTFGMVSKPAASGCSVMFWSRCFNQQLQASSVCILWCTMCKRDVTFGISDASRCVLKENPHPMMREGKTAISQRVYLPLCNNRFSPDCDGARITVQLLCTAIEHTTNGKQTDKQRAANSGLVKSYPFRPKEDGISSPYLDQHVEISTAYLDIRTQRGTP